MACRKIISVYLWREEANDKLPVPDTMQSFNISLIIHSPVILLADPSPVPGSGDRETFCLHAEKPPAWAGDVAGAGGSHRVAVLQECPEHSTCSGSQSRPQNLGPLTRAEATV